MMKFKKFVSFFYLFILIVSFVFSFNPINLLVHIVSASWWDADWDYKKQITVTDKWDDYQVCINVTNSSGGDVDCNSHAQSDFDDLRFLDSTETVELPYWVEYKVDNSYVVVWVNTSINDSTLYMYYGNSGVSSSNSSSSTWDYWYDWTSDHTGDYTKYTGDSSKNYAYCTAIPSFDLTSGKRILNYMNLSTLTITNINTMIYFMFSNTADDYTDALDRFNYELHADTDYTPQDTIHNIAVENGGSPSYDYDQTYLNSIDHYDIYEMIGSNYTNMTLNVYGIHSKGTLLVDSFVNTIANIPPDTMGYVGYGGRASNGVPSNDYWSYDAVNDAVRWGVTYTSSSTIVVNSKYFCIGKYNYTEPSFSFGSETPYTPSNTPPVVESPSPSNGATDVSISTNQLSVWINDTEGDSFNWTITTSPNIGNDGANGASNGSKTCSISGLQSHTVYTWYVNTTDWEGSGEWNNKTYTFTTENNAPSVTGVIPSNGSVVDITPICNVTVVDDDADEMTVNWYEGNSTKLTEVDSWSDKNYYAHQGVCFNDTYVWASINDGVYKWKRSDKSLEVSATTGITDNVSFNHLGSLVLVGDYLYISVCNYDDPPEPIDNSSIAVVWAGNLTFIQEILLCPSGSDNFWADGIDYHSVDGVDYFWVRLGYGHDTTFKIGRYDTEFNLSTYVNYTITPIENIQDICWYGDYIFTTDHDSNMVEKFKWNGSGFDHVDYYNYSDGEVPASTNQGIKYYKDEDIFAFCQRNLGGAGVDYISFCKPEGWKLVQTNSSVANNSIVYFEYVNASAYNHTYWWMVNLTDGEDTDSEFYYFSTSEYVEYVNTNPTATFNPANATLAGSSISTNMNVSVVDADGNNTFANWSCSDGSSGSWSDQPNGTQECDLSILDYDTIYYFYINITDDYGGNSYYWVYFVTESGSGANDSNHAYFIPDGTISESGDMFQWPSDGKSHYLKVDDNNSGYPVGEFDDFSTYVGILDNPSVTDVYTISNHTTEFGTITNVKVVLRCYLQAGTGYAYAVIKHNGTLYYSPSFTLTPYSFADYYYNWSVTPDTGESWSWSDIDNLGVGVKLSTWNHVAIYCSQVYVEVTYGPVYPPTNLTGVLYNDYLNITWDTGINADSTLIRKNTGDYPSDPTDGDLCQNSSLEYYNESYVSNTYYSFWSWNDTLSLYSEKIDFAYGGLLVNVFDEKTELNITGWNIFISNLNGSQVYSQTGCNNTLTIDVDDCPQGDVTILINATGYNNRVYSMSIYTGAWYSLDAYLPPTTPAGGGTSDCSQQVYIDSVIVSNPDVDAIINLTHDLDEIISVEIYNISLYESYGGWYFVPSDYFSYNTSAVVVNNTILDENISMARVNYYYLYCSGEVESLLFVIQVVDVYNLPINNALITVKKYINSTGVFETITSIYSDGNGEIEVYLIPSVLYKVFITKSGYDDLISDYVPDISVRTKIFKMSITTTIPIGYDSFVFNISFTNVMTGSGYMQLGNITSNYTDSNSSTVNTDYYLYEYFNGSYTLLAYYHNSSNSFSLVNGSINTTRSHKVVLFFNNTADFIDQSSPVVVVIPSLYVYTTDSGFTPFNLDDRVTPIVGPMVINGVSIPWGSVLAFGLGIVVLVLLGPFHIGIALIGAGLMNGFVSGLFSMFLTDEFPVGLVTLCPVLVIFGIMYIMSKSGREII